MKINVYLQKSPIFVVKNLSRKFDMQSSKMLTKGGLGITEGLVLAAICFEDPFPVKPGLLAETFDMTRGAISHVISSLEGKGLIVRAIDPSDARAYLIRLKPAGKRHAMYVIAIFDALQHSFEEKVGKQSLEDALNLLRSL